MQARRNGLFSFKQNSALCGRELAEPTPLLLAYCCLFLAASEPTGATTVVGGTSASSAGESGSGTGPVGHPPARASQGRGGRGGAEGGDWGGGAGLSHQHAGTSPGTGTLVLLA
ncbi:hypothetical protein Q7C36_020516 [Tachysurus vachellii]|uniref:Uncharacterized protein n=1 Tax=Tachysurus vachellii TaxID=175792 RepID=A0AA88JB29_TACVA|nr:hypothetical protein Q7C36_020516 [Tachysurus vachellii]